jgi:hypothetical protein
MRFGNVFSASVAAAALAVAYTIPAHASIVVDIDKSAQTMTVSVDGAERYSWPVSTGRPGYDTPNGTFKPNRMDADHMSQEWDNAPMPHSIFFDNAGHAIHGFFDVKHLGQAVSHGCVRLSPQNAALLYDLVSKEGMKDTTVVVSGHAPRGGVEMARRSPPVEAGQPIDILPTGGSYGRMSYYQQSRPYYYARRPMYYGAQGYPAQRYYYGQPGYAQPQYYVLQPFTRY